MRRIANRFLKSGSLGSTDEKSVAEFCDKLVRSEIQRSLTSAVALAKSFVRQARPHGGILLLTAFRALGWTLQSSGHYREAEKAYLKARELSGRDAIVRARIDRILIDTYMYLGDFAEAKRRARNALATFRRLGADADAAKTQVNYGNLFHRQDRHRDAYRQYGAAADYFRHRGDNFAVGLCAYNQANVLVQLFNFNEAEELYKRAEEKFSSLDMHLYANESRYGLAWLSMLRGDYHLALTGLADCETRYEKAGHDKGVMLCQLDRAEAYLGLNLFTDARNAARESERKGRRLGLHYESAKAAFFLSKAAHAVGRGRESALALERARDGFGQIDNQGFLAAVELHNYQSLTDHKGLAPKLRRARSRFKNAQLPLWEAICDLQILALYPNDAGAFNRLGRNKAVKAVPHLYAQWQTFLGDRQAGRGKMSMARAHWSNAVQRLDAVRAKLPPVELRTSFLQHRSDPYLRLIATDLPDRPNDASVWLERYRTAGPWGQLDRISANSEVRDKARVGLAELARQVTVLSARIGKTSGQRSAVSPTSERALEQLQKQVRINLAHLDKSAGTATMKLEDIRAEIDSVAGRLPIVSFHFEQNDLIAIVQSGEDTRSHRYVGGRKIVAEYNGCWQLQLSRALRSEGKQSRYVLQDETSLFDSLGDWLWRPLELASDHRSILVIPEGRLSNLPWNAIRSNGAPIVEQHHLILSPSIRHHKKAYEQRVLSNDISVFVGRTDGLDHTHREVSSLLDRVGAGVHVADPCRREDWPDNSEARIWHYTGHAQLRSDNPFYSSLILQDGPLFAADFRLMNNRIGLVTLAACRTGQQVYFPGEESTGLVRSLLEMGARNVLASHWAVEDKSTAIWMQEFYNKYISGDSLGEAAKQATLAVRENYPSAYNWASFSIFGA